MKKQIEYCWLTGPTFNDDLKSSFFGSAGELFLPFLFRHGRPGYIRKKPLPWITTDEYVQSILEGDRRYYLATVEAEGRLLDLAKAFFLPKGLGQIVVPREVFGELRKACHLDDGRDLPINPRWVFAHQWSYTVPEDPKTSVLYEQMLDAIGLEEEPGEDEIMRRLCRRHPSSRQLPPMHLILPPSLASPLDDRYEVQRHWRADRIVLSLNDKNWIHLPTGERMPPSESWMRKQPIIEYKGFLIPPSVAHLFPPDRNKLPLVFVKDVIIELP